MSDEEQPEAAAPAEQNEAAPVEPENLPDEQDVTALIAKYDKSGNGKLEFDEFLGFMKEALKIGDTPPGFLKQMRFMFDGMDLDASHSLDKSEILTCFQKLKDNDFKYITRMIFRGADVDKSRKVSVSELSQALQNNVGIGLTMDDFDQKCELEFKKKKKELEYWEFYKLFSGETLDKNSPDYDPYEGKYEEKKSKCCLLL